MVTCPDILYVVDFAAIHRYNSPKHYFETNSNSALLFAAGLTAGRQVFSSSHEINTHTSYGFFLPQPLILNTTGTLLIKCTSESCDTVC